MPKKEIGEENGNKAGSVVGVFADQQHLCFTKNTGS